MAAGTGKGFIELCSFYLNPEKECKKDCGRLHLCREFALTGGCSFGQKCRNGHDFHNPHNKLALKSTGFGDQSERTVRKFLVDYRTHSTIPIVCKQHREGREPCRYRDKCAFLHVCPNLLEKKCTTINCTLDHDVSGEQNQNVLKKYGFDCKKSSANIIREIQEMNAEIKTRLEMKRADNGSVINDLAQTVDYQRISNDRLASHNDRLQARVETVEERERLRERLRDLRLSDLTDCRICFDQQQDWFAIRPCGHVLCSECIKLIYECPFCRQDIEGKLRLF